MSRVDVDEPANKYRQNNCQNQHLHTPWEDLSAAARQDWRRKMREQTENA